MHVLVTAGNTQAPIDRVRCITNIFTGRTGARIALEAHARGHAVTLVTSHPEVVRDLAGAEPAERWSVRAYRTFQELEAHMAEVIPAGRLDAVVHCAAVSDYLSSGVYAPAPGTAFDPETLTWQCQQGAPALADRAAGKVKSDEPELWLRLVRSPKLVDRIRPEWGFRGTLVKFKLEVGVDDARLLEVAEESRRQSAADLMVANTLEGSGEYAFLGPVGGGYVRVSRDGLAARLLEVMEQREGQGDG